MAFLSRWPKSHVALIWLEKEATGSRGQAKVPGPLLAYHVRVVPVPGRRRRRGCCPSSRRAGSGAALFRMPEGRRKPCLSKSSDTRSHGATAVVLLATAALLFA
jgi:hypothetical protein